MSEITIPTLPADLPEDFQLQDIIAPNGADIGKPVQRGYNYLMQQMNETQRAVMKMAEESNSALNTVVTDDGGIHGIRYLSGKLQIKLPNGWATLAQVTKGLRSTYVDAQNKTTFEIDSMQYTSLKIDDLIEVEE